MVVGCYGDVVAVAEVGIVVMYELSEHLPRWSRSWKSRQCCSCCWVEPEKKTLHLAYLLHQVPLVVVSGHHCCCCHVWTLTMQKA
jgi:hypothetical protein